MRTHPLFQARGREMNGIHLKALFKDPGCSSVISVPSVANGFCLQRSSRMVLIYYTQIFKIGSIKKGGLFPSRPSPGCQKGRGIAGALTRRRLRSPSLPRSLNPGAWPRIAADYGAFRSTFPDRAGCGRSAPSGDIDRDKGGRPDGRNYG